MFELLYAFGGSNGIYIYMTVITSTSYWSLSLQKHGFLNEGFLARYEERVWWRTVREVVEIESFYQIVDKQQLLVVTEADVSAVRTTVRIYASDITMYLHARL